MTDDETNSWRIWNMNINVIILVVAVFKQCEFFQLLLLLSVKNENTQQFWKHYLKKINSSKQCNIWNVFLWAISIPSLFFSIFLFSIQLTVNIIQHKWIPTAGFWCQKRPLYQLSHNHCPISLKILLSRIKLK